MKKWFCCMGTLLMALTALGKYTGSIYLDRRDGIYRVGDTITCRVRLVKDGKPLRGTRARVTIKFEGKTVAVKTFTTTGRPVAFTYKADKPGWVYFGVEVLNKDGRVLKGKGVFRYPHKKSIVLEMGAMIDPAQLPAIPAPEDFAAFWAARRAALDKVPIAPVIEPMECGNERVKLYKVTVPTVGEYPVTGYLAIPANARPRSCRVFVEWASWSASDANRNSAIKHALAGDIGFTTTWHGRPVNKGKKWYNYKTTIKINGGMVLTSSISLINSPPFVPMVAAVLHDKSVILPGIAIGLLGYAVGNYLGIGIFMLLTAAGG